MLIPFNPREESFFRVSLFLTLYYPPELTEPRPFLPLSGNSLQSGLSGYIKSKLLDY